MKTETTGSRKHYWQVYWIGLIAAAFGGGWLAISAFRAFALVARDGARAGVSPWLIAQTLCACGLVIAGFSAMAGSSAFAAGSAIDFDRRSDFDDDATTASRRASAPGDVDGLEFDIDTTTATVDHAQIHGPPKPFIMIRCRRCETLNSEHRATCTACEHPV